MYIVQFSVYRKASEIMEKKKESDTDTRSMAEHSIIIIMTMIYISMGCSSDIHCLPFCRAIIVHDQQMTNIKICMFNLAIFWYFSDTFAKTITH